MWWVSLCSVLAVVLSAGCGKESKGVPSGGTKGEAARWTFVGFVDSPHNRLAVMWAPGRVGLMAPDGQMRATLETSAKAEDIGVKSNGATILVMCPESAAVARFHAVDATAGTILWTKELPPMFAVMGESTVAVAGDADVRLLALTSGAEAWAAKGSVSAIRFVAGHGFVLQYADHLELLDESGKVRWRQGVEGLTKAGIVADASRVYVLRADRTFEERKTVDGVFVSKGTCAGKASKTDNPLNCAGPRGSALFYRAAPGALDEREGRHDYYLSQSETEGKEQLVAADRVGRERWRAGWEANTSVVDPSTERYASSIKALALIAGDSYSARTLLVYDDETGKLLIKRVLRPRDRLIGFAESCWVLVTDENAVKCIDGRSGTETWTLATSGTSAGAWIRNDVVFVADGNPLALSRLTKDGKRVWERELPDTELRDGDLMRVARAGVFSALSWSLSDVMALVQTESGHYVVDLTNGRKSW